jgi:hypothetical protein
MHLESALTLQSGTARNQTLSKMMKSKWLIVLALMLVGARSRADDPGRGWTYTYEMNPHATRTYPHSLVGKLLYKGVILPGKFRWVITPIGEFQNVAPALKDTIWIPSGVTGTEADIKSCLAGKDPACRRTAIKAGGTVSYKAYLEGTFGKPPDGVGPDWLFVVDKGLWVNPAKIDEALKAKFPQE